jgi:microcystin degradation protein MlrC
MRTGEKTNTVREHPALMWPPTGTATVSEPMRSLEEMAREIEQEGEEVLGVNVLAGFAFADVPDAGVSFTVVTLGEPERERSRLRRLAETANRMRDLGNVVDPPVEEIMGQVSRLREGPIVIAEPSDNSGAGAPGSGTGLLRALLENHIENAIVVINDREAVQKLKNAQKGKVTQLLIGGKGSRFYGPPIEVDAELISTSEGQFELEDPRSHLASLCGRHIDMGPCAVIEYRGIRILLTSRRTPPFDLGQLRSQGIEPEEAFVIGVKAAVAHHQAYKPIACALYSVDTAGPCSSNLRSLPYHKVQRPIYPLDE